MDADIHADIDAENEADDLVASTDMSIPCNYITPDLSLTMSEILFTTFNATLIRTFL